ncbi:site-specific integrase [Aminomonas paucivorans]|uniref:site-specific integrase n=1 Tax=Aminomonas paucivorans TaxID=81412 RepID=UPI00332CD334
MQEKLTQAMVQGLASQAARYSVRDTVLPGLILRVDPSGRKTYYIDYVRPDTFRRTSYKLGRADHLTVAQAREAAKDFLASVHLGEDPAEKRRHHASETLGDFILRHYAPWVRENRRSGDATIKRILASFAPLLPLPVQDLTPLRLERWRSDRRRGGTLKAATLNRDVGSLKAALNWGAKHGILAHNPIAGMEMLQERDSEAKVRYLSEDERSRLFAALDEREERLRQERERYNAWLQERKEPPKPDLRTVAFADHLKPMVILSLNTGIRRSSLFGLEWRDVDFDNENLTVRAAVAKAGKTYHVPLNRAALDMLRKWRGQSRGNGLVFPSPKTGGVFENCDSSWVGVLKDAGIENFRWHDMRHDFASHLVMAGVDLNTVRELLGHANLTMTLRYAHLAPEVKRRAVGVLPS